MTLISISERANLSSIIPAWGELGPAQPQLVSRFSFEFCPFCFSMEKKNCILLIIANDLSMETLWLKKRDSEDSPKSDLDLRFVNIDLVSLTFGHT